MSRRLKELVETELKDRYDGVDSAILVNVHGLSGVEANQFRATLAKSEIEVHVVKNSAAKRVFAGTTLEPLSAALVGPCALVTGGRSPVDTAKELLRLAKEYPKLEFRGGLVEGETDLIPVEDLSTRRSKAEIQGDVVALAISPGRRIAGCLNVGGKIAGCIKAIADKLEKGEAITRVA